MFAKLTGFLILLLAFGAIQANADSIYEVIGTLTIPGNSSNPGVSETINYSFELDYSQLDVNYVVGTPVITSFGPVFTFSLEHGASGAFSGYIGFFSQSSTGYAEIDLLGYFSPF
jgi:hypothetical protein